MAASLYGSIFTWQLPYMARATRPVDKAWAWAWAWASMGVLSPTSCVGVDVAFEAGLVVWVLPWKTLAWCPLEHGTHL